MLDNKSRSELINKSGGEGINYIYGPVQAIQQYIENEISSRVAVIQENYDAKIKGYDAKLEKIYDECNNLYQSYHLGGGW
ncbi:MAG: hypothetical protein PG981_000937 [Wolbachia endosymbiont of Ctenocephalides orientis wCori]|nr:MAG: hypothetical protein PG981_000937 [Wolbachia endosymbiont of Ctenocephalides orientis wCori]